MKNTFIHRNTIAILLIALIVITSIGLTGCKDEKSVATVDETAANTENITQTVTESITVAPTTSTSATEATKVDETASDKPDDNQNIEQPENTIVSEGNTSHQHTHSYGWVTIKADCTNDGYTVYSCACGAKYTSDYVDALGHEWGGWVTVKEATTESEGKKQNTCDRCGKIKTESIDKVLGPFDYPAVENPDLVSERVIYYINYYRGSNTYSPSVMEQYVAVRADQIVNNYSHDVNDMQLAKDISGARINGECLGHIANLNYTVDEAAFEIVEQFRLGSPLYGSTHWDIITNPNVKCLSVGIYISDMNIYTCVATSYIEQ